MSKQAILLVDDEPLIRLSLAHNLEQEGYEVRQAENGKQALSLLLERPCDLLLTDHLMAEMTGAELMKQARQLTPHVKVIIFSGFEAEDSAGEMLGLGADAFLGKPIDFEILLARIASVLKGAPSHGL